MFKFFSSGRNQGSTLEANRERTLVGLLVMDRGGLFLGPMVVISGRVGGARAAGLLNSRRVQPGARCAYGGMMAGQGAAGSRGPRGQLADRIDLDGESGCADQDRRSRDIRAVL